MRKLILSGVIMFLAVQWVMAQGTTYCGSNGSNSSSEYISRVRLRHIDNKTLSDAGYGNYTSISTILTQGTWDTLRITPKWAGTIYNEGYSVWIDFNKDGDFTDSAEQVLNRAASNDTLITKPFFIPFSAQLGATRMRVAMKWNGVPTSCETFTYGEVEDYTINIACASKGLVADYEYIDRIRIRNLDIVSGMNHGYVDFTARSGTLAKGNYDTIIIKPKWAGTIYREGYSVWIDYNRDGDFADTLEQVVQKSASTDTLIRASFFVPSSALTGFTRMRVSMKYNGIPTSCETFQYGEVEDYSVKISSNEKVYCVSKGLNASYEYINKVQIGYLNNISGTNGGYGNFTAVSTNVARDSAIGIKITPAWTSTVYNEGYSVWMDYNKDGDFTDSAEQVLTIPASTTPPDYAYFFIPASVALGPVRMRVSMKYNGIPSSCEVFQYGEVEDYTINIVNKRAVYCRSRGTSVANGYIDRVQVGVAGNGGSMDHISGSDNGYGNFSRNTGIRPVLTRDSASSISIFPWLVVNHTTGYSIWIDYNSDGDFADSKEQIVSIYGLTDYPATFRFVVPASAPLGYTRMRVAVRFGGVAASCDSFPYGEVEDYTVYIKDRVSLTGKSSSNQRLITYHEASDRREIPVNYLYPNPAKNYLNIRIAENTAIKSIKVVSGSGATFHPAQSAGRIDVSTLRPGIYLLVVETDQGLIREKFIKE